MAKSSKLYKGEKDNIIDDSTTEGELEDMARKFSRGLLLPRGRENVEHAYEGAADKFPASLLIPESEWEARIRENEERKTRLSDLVEQAGLPCKDQDGIPYCWIYGPTHAMEVLRVVQGQPKVILSAASPGAIIKNFRKQGGWGKEGLSFIAGVWGGSKKGVVPQHLWPEAAVNRSYDTAANWQEALKYVCQEWWELRPRNFAEHVSLLLRRHPAAVGLNYWSHEVTDYEPVILDGETCIRYRNSWGMSWGSGGGYGIRRGNKKYADDIVSPRSATAA